MAAQVAPATRVPVAEDFSSVAAARVEAAKPGFLSKVGYLNALSAIAGVGAGIVYSVPGGPIAAGIGAVVSTALARKALWLASKSAIGCCRRRLGYTAHVAPSGSASVSDTPEAFQKALYEFVVKTPIYIKNNLFADDLPIEVPSLRGLGTASVLVKTLFTAKITANPLKPILDIIIRQIISNYQYVYKVKRDTLNQAGLEKKDFDNQLDLYAKKIAANFYDVFYNHTDSKTYERAVLNVFADPLRLNVRGRPLRKSYKLEMSDIIAKEAYRASIDLLKVMSSGVEIIKKSIAQLQGEVTAAAAPVAAAPGAVPIASF